MGIVRSEAPTVETMLRNIGLRHSTTAKLAVCAIVQAVICAAISPAPCFE